MSFGASDPKVLLLNIETGQRGFLARLFSVLAPGGFLVVGADEPLPAGVGALEPLVEPFADPVVAVEKVDEVPAGPGQAGVEVGDVADVAGLVVERDAISVAGDDLGDPLWRDWAGLPHWRWGTRLPGSVK